MAGFDADCRRCPRLVAHRESVRERFPDFFARPVPAFGPDGAPLLVLGLAPGLRGSYRTGRAFTGDFSGKILFAALHRHGLSSRAEARAADDGLVLRDCRISNAVKCLPPANRPTGAEIDRCNPYLAGELAALPRGGVVLALGTVAHRAVLKALDLRASAHRFAHGGRHRLPGGRWLLDSYHCSRYNVQTRRLTAEMLDAVVARAAALARSVQPRSVIPDGS